jgi:excinuclease UvrABC nuclease subunit
MAEVYWLHYRFFITAPFTTGCFQDISGVYIFAKPAAHDRWIELKVGTTKALAKRLQREFWVPLYIGQATNLAQRLRLNHREHWATAERLGATHVHICFVPQPWYRSAIERQLIKEFDPPVNNRLRERRLIRADDL